MLITLLTDFGTSDYFVAAMKGRILSVNSNITLVDISHEIPAHDIGTAAFVLGAVHADFPAGTIHVVVVDPGVGSARRPIVARACGQLFVAPDNGVLGLVLAKDPHAAVRIIEVEPTGSVGATFHGRDLFAPIAARLATGLFFEEVGAVVGDPVLVTQPEATGDSEGTIHGRIIHIDHFGNCVTNIGSERLDSENGGGLEVGGRVVREVREYYQSSDGPGPFLIRGSAGYVELSMLHRSAAKEIGIRRGDRVLYRPGLAQEA